MELTWIMLCELRHTTVIYQTVIYSEIERRWNTESLLSCVLGARVLAQKVNWMDGYEAKKSLAFDFDGKKVSSHPLIAFSRNQMDQKT